MVENQTIAASHAEGPKVAGRFVVLDGVRGVAAIMVLILHSAMIFPNAFLAVDLFFMLSGFVLAHGYGERIGTGAGRLRFAISRLIRLEPLYLAGCLIALPAVIGMGFYGWNYFTLPVVALATVTAPFFIILPYDGYTIPLNPPGWSLSFELIANALFVFVGLRWTRLIPVLIVSAALLLWGMTMYHGGVTGWHSFWGAFPRTFFSFFTGALLYRLWREQLILPRFSIPVALLLALVVAMCVVEPVHYRNYHAAAIFLINPTIIWLGACAGARGLLARACEYLGNLSYGVYVLHVPIIMWAEGIRFLLVDGTTESYQPAGGTAWITIPVSLIAAHYLTVRFEVPVRRYLAARFLKRDATPQAYPLGGRPQENG